MRCGSCKADLYLEAALSGGNESHGPRQKVWQSPLELKESIRSNPACKRMELTERWMKPKQNTPVIAYFSMEIALDPNIPTYSGGLGARWRT